MTDWTGNVVLTRAASEALRREFIGWQCRLRQLAAREHGGRPGAGMRPRVVAEDGSEISPGIVTLIIESEPENSTELFRYQYLKTQDPNERCDKIVEILQGSYFQEPSRFSDLMTALFGPRSALAALLCARGAASSTSSNTARAIAFPARSRGSPSGHPFYQATYWHNRLFNPNLPAAVEILSFRPDWPHSARYRLDPEAER